MSLRFPVACLAAMFVFLFAALFFFAWASSGVGTSIREYEPQLRAHAEAIRAGKISRIGPRSLLYPVPSVPMNIEHVTMDSNGNVFFVTFSTTFMDEGFLLRNGDAEVVGSGMEPHVEVEHLFGDWWLFGA